MIRGLPALSYRLAAVALLAAALGLSACGRKGPLDAPPGGLAASPTGSLDQETEEGGEVIRKGTARGLPIIRGPDRPIPLDVLLN
ncbi:LPS translocon maturation chaperone LptM [Pseudorhodoplanes sp.]|uniref:LPS translocon maturation chaperone LptM n=1 Tax=Pseudorhodoplanes sp. TaxID=1934341 RepID=UPI002CE1D493|nr:lipoprotein [Pseudorhodoplanes sp.]HWV51409.1 lipoprotein [Pseudorhodoplanes sp.]